MVADSLRSAVERHKVAASSASVCLVAAAVQAYALWGPPTLGPLGDFLFGCLETDVVGFAVPAAYFRVAVPAGEQESRARGVYWALVVGAAALLNVRLWESERVSSFALLFGTLAASYARAATSSNRTWEVLLVTLGAGAAAAVVAAWGLVWLAATVAAGLAASLLGEKLFWKLKERNSWPMANASSGATLFLARWGFVAAVGIAGSALLPRLALEVAKFLLPVRELSQAYDLVGTFVGQEKRDRLALKLMLVTAFCQVSLGYLGIAFLRRGQERKNALISVGDGKLTARSYARLVGIYMVAAALPYILQRTIVENVNSYVAGNIEREVERSLRISGFFPKNNAGKEDLLLAAIHGSKYTVDGYTDAFNSLVSVSYATVELKLFTLPKLLLLPGMLVNQPWLVVSVLPASIVLDIGRTRMITMMTQRIEALSRQIRELDNRRQKIEQHDTKHEELIRRGASTAFAEAAWRKLAADIQASSLRQHALSSLRMFINALYKQDFLGPGIELVLAWLLQFKQIPLSDIWVYTRVVEDTIDLLLTRFRMDATLASLKTNMDRVTDLSERLAKTRARGRAACSFDQAGGVLQITDLKYTRGSSLEVHLTGLVLRAGRIYAVTGPNGSGKSSLFGILASCSKAGPMLPGGLQIRELGALVLPTDDIVEITQQLYCPLFVKPLAWMLQQSNLEALPPEELQRYEQRITELSGELEFHRRDEGTAEQGAGLTSEELQIEMEDWYGTLSGGQRGKVEFIRKVFLREHCPDILLIDEAFGPLDPKSKLLVQRKLKEFCSNSIILVIYHGGASEQCLPSDGFFDESLHFGNGTATLQPTC